MTAWGKHEGLSREVAVRGDGLHRASLPLVARRAHAARASRAAAVVPRDLGDQPRARRRAAEPVRRLRTLRWHARIRCAAFAFCVEIDGIASGGFARVKGLSREVKHESYREGGVNEYEHKLLHAGDVSGRRARSAASRSTTCGSGRWRPPTATCSARPSGSGCRTRRTSRRGRGRSSTRCRSSGRRRISTRSVVAGGDGEPRAGASRAEEGDMRLTKPRLGSEPSRAASAADGTIAARHRGCSSRRTVLLRWARSGAQASKAGRGLTSHRARWWSLAQSSAQFAHAPCGAGGRVAVIARGQRTSTREIVVFWRIPRMVLALQPTRAKVGEEPGGNATFRRRVAYAPNADRRGHSRHLIPTAKHVVAALHGRRDAPRCSVAPELSAEQASKRAVAREDAFRPAPCPRPCTSTRGARAGARD